MAASVQLLAQAGAARVAAAEPTLFRPGQVLQALVLGRLAGGLTELKIGDVLVVAQLPQGLLPGTVLQLQVKSGGSAPQLALLSQMPPMGEAATTVALPALPPLQMLPEASVSVRIVESQQEPVVVVSQPELASAGVAVAVIGRADAPVQATTAPAVRGGPPVPIALSSASAPGEIVPQGAASTEVVKQPASAPVVVGRSPPPEVAGPNSVLGSVQTAAGPAVSITPVVVAEPVASASLPAVAQSAAPVTAVAPAVIPVSQPELVSSAVVAATPMSPAAQAMPSVPAAGAQVAVRPATMPVDPAEAAAPGPSQPATLAVSNLAPHEAESQPEPEASNPLLLAQIAPRPQATLADLPKLVVSAPAAVLTSGPTPPPATPVAALAQMVPEAMATQNSLAPLLTSLAALAEKPAMLPEPVMRAALQVLAQRIVVADGEVAARQIEQAVARSGVFLEAGLAKATPQQGDIKAALLALKSTLTSLLGSTPSTSSGPREPPPVRGMPPRAADIAPAALPDGARDMAKALHGQADAAVSRVKLMQLASLPDAGPVRTPGHELRMELPFLIGHELVMAQIQITRDGARRETERKRGWTMRFAMHFANTGEVGAEIGILDKSVNVALWAAEPETAVALNSALPELTAALDAMGLKPGAIRCRNGVPEPVRLQSGQLLDSVS